MRRSIRDVILRALAVASLLIAQPHSRAAPPVNSPRAVVSRFPPIYPELARRMHLSGQVVIRVDIRADGSVSKTHIESGHALLRQAADQAVHRWRFAAGPSPSEFIVAIHFAADAP